MQLQFNIDPPMVTDKSEQNHSLISNESKLELLKIVDDIMVHGKKNRKRIEKLLQDLNKK